MRIIPGGFGFVGQFFSAVIAGLFFLVAVIIIVGVLFVLVRFLIAATRAADTYVRIHEAPKSEADYSSVAPSAPVTPVTPPPTASSPPTPSPAAPSPTAATTPPPTLTTPTVTKPATKPRTPKVPPTT